MTMKPPVRQQGYVTRGVLQDAIKEIRRDLEDGGIVTPDGKTPKGTGFRHITNDVEDSQAKTVSTTDIDDHAVSFIKIQNVDSGTIVGRLDAGPGELQELGGTTEARSVLGLVAQPHIADPAGGAVVDIEGRAATAAILGLLEALLLMEP